jgi:ferric-dicitrate binding protein FerR (iron transport regulator)
MSEKPQMDPTKQPAQPFPRLVQAVLDGTATATQHVRLADLLREDAHLRAEYVQQLRLDALLHFTGGAVAKTTVPASSRAHENHFSTFRFFAAAAAVLLIGLSALWWSRRGVEVEVVQTADFTSHQWRAGTKVRLNHLSLPRGRVEFRLPSGVWLEVVAPAELQFVNAMHLRVSLGQVTADVGDRGKGFVVDTAQTKIVDLGTKFGVAVPNAGHTDVVVFEGEVEVFDRKAPRASAAPLLTRLFEGEAVRVNAQRQLSRIMNVTSGPRDAAWSTGGGETGAVITSVHDNLRDPTELYYYRILAGGLHEDAPAFVAKRHEWNGLDAAGIPAELLGADLVQTFPSDRDNTALEIIVTVARPAVIYVLADSRTEPPAWLVQNFTATGALIGLENAPMLTSGKPVGRGPGEGNMAGFAVWKRTLPDGGRVKLGPAGVTTGEIRQWMYGIAAKAL